VTPATGGKLAVTTATVTRCRSAYSFASGGHRQAMSIRSPVESPELAGRVRFTSIRPAIGQSWWPKRGRHRAVLERRPGRLAGVPIQRACTLSDVLAA